MAGEKVSWEVILIESIRKNDVEKARVAITQAGARISQLVQYGDGCYPYGPILVGSDAKEYDTALHIAIRLKAFEVARLLVDAGLDMSQENYFGETPCHIYTSLHLSNDPLNE